MEGSSPKSGWGLELFTSIDIVGFLIIASAALYLDWKHITRMREKRWTFDENA